MTANALRQLCAQRHARHAFTIVEMLVSVAVLVLLLLMVLQLTNNATAVTRTGHKRIDTDTEARTVLDRMAVDLAQMLRRTDVDYYVKAPSGYKNPKAHGNGLKLKSGQEGNDQIAFFSQVPGNYPTGYPAGTSSPLSLVAYRVRSKTGATFLQLERMGKGLLWNAVDNTTKPSSPYPLVFMPGQISAGTGPWTTAWYAAVNNDNTGKSDDTDYEVIAPGVFRLEYYYLLKDGTVTDIPALTWIPYPGKTVSANLNAFKDVEAIVVAIAVIDRASRAMVSQTQLFNLMSDMADFQHANGNGFGGQAKVIGDVENEWNTVIKNAATTGHTSGGSADTFPPTAASAVRVYNRYFELKTL
jgi:Prokaryotic N-terminal methylation motif